MYVSIDFLTNGRTIRNIIIRRSVTAHPEVIMKLFFFHLLNGPFHVDGFDSRDADPFHFCLTRSKQRIHGQSRMVFLGYEFQDFLLCRRHGLVGDFIAEILDAVLFADPAEYRT